MADAPEGGCRCGQVRFAISAPPLVTMACHCTGCQRMTGSAFSLSVAVPKDAFQITHGQPVIGGLHGIPFHNFCPHCMSWMFTRMPEAVGPFVNVRATMLDRPMTAPPFIETWTRERLPWAVTGAAHSFEEFPPPDSFPGLLRDFAARSAAPD